MRVRLRALKFALDVLKEVTVSERNVSLVLRGVSLVKMDLQNALSVRLVRSLQILVSLVVRSVLLVPSCLVWVPRVLRSAWNAPKVLLAPHSER